MLQKDTVHYRKKIHEAQRTVAKAVRTSRKGWIEQVSKEVEEAGPSGSTGWVCIKKLQSVHAGRHPVQVESILNESGLLLSQQSVIKDRWFRHFTKVLSAESSFNPDAINHVPEHPPHLDLDAPLTRKEFLEALKSMTIGKSGSESGVLPEMGFHGGPYYLYECILNLMHTVWKRGSVVPDWRDTTVVPISKKGDLHSCDNWHGISLLDVVGKLFARILQRRLQSVAEDILPESQAGF